MKKLRVLFITPAAHRSGAPMLMLHLIRYLRRQPDFEGAAVLVTDGEMAAELAAELPVQIFRRDASHARLRYLLRKLPWVRSLEKRAAAARCRRWLDRQPPDVVYCNSAAGAEVLDALGPYSCPVVTNLHELEHVLQSITWIPGGAVAPMLRHTTHFLAGSQAVRRNLVARHGVDAHRITVVHDFITTADFPALASGETTHVHEMLRARLGLSAEARVIGAIATPEWRKGADLFVAMARLLPPVDAAGRPIHLVWVGGAGLEEMSRLRFDVETAGLGERIHLAGPTRRTADWYGLFTVFALLSREDPFPLVALEAAASGVPVVCFADGGGMPEFVEDDAGIVVPFLDLPAFAGALRRVIDDPALRARLGAAAAAKVRARHDVGVAVPQIMDLLRKLAVTPPTS